MRRGIGKGMSVAPVVAVVAAVGTLGPAFAMAAEEPEDEGFAGAFRIHASRGYEIVGIVSRQPKDKLGELLLIVTRKHESAVYFVPATVSSTALVADLGSLGGIDFKLVPSGVKRRLHSRCDKGSSVEFESATYEGRFEFHGEEGFTDATATRTPYRLQPIANLTCAGSVFGDLTGRRLPGARLTVRWKNRDERFELRLHKNRPSLATRFQADLQERTGDVLVARSVEGIAAPSGFEYEPDLGSATVELRPPFSGSARFGRGAPGARRWSGDLAVDFPGRSNVPIATSRSQAYLVHARFTREVIHPDLKRGEKEGVGAFVHPWWQKAPEGKWLTRGLPSSRVDSMGW
jgi:hypothetical protein